MIKNDKRAKMADHLLVRGHATMEEILTACFGEWPPKGLDISPDVSHDMKVDFKLRDFEYGGMVYWGGSTIHVNKALQSFGTKPTAFGLYFLTPIIGHEGTHILQGKSGKSKLQNTSNVAMNDLQDYADLFPQKGRLLSASFNAAARKETVKRYAYFSSGIEMQARLHEMMADGYQCWGKMPQTRDELWQAFASFGIKPPADIAKHLASLPDESTTWDFRLPISLDTRAGKQVQAVHDLLPKQAREKFWRETLHVIYADLIALYGDNRGAELFGLDPKERVTWTDAAKWDWKEHENINNITTMRLPVKDRAAAAAVISDLKKLEARGSLGVSAHKNAGTGLTVNISGFYYITMLQYARRTLKKQGEQSSAAALPRLKLAS